ncbi:hypothetical protein [Kitasatospora sp. NPDC047058]|uniref:hypothetical protein n=1 Tax=Kitasatospora sp. NPDC047058 TaxID=3155620 RepID=UPI0033CBAAE3
MGRHRRTEGIIGAAPSVATVTGHGVYPADGPAPVACDQDARPGSAGSGEHGPDDTASGHGGDAVIHDGGAGSGTTIEATGRSGGTYSLAVRP